MGHSNWPVKIEQTRCPSSPPPPPTQSRHTLRNTQEARPEDACVQAQGAHSSCAHRDHRLSQTSTHLGGRKPKKGENEQPDQMRH